ncbi:short-chain dehydrogenase [Clostridium acetobutylicum]|nr:short-chain dehydrogenase [Clostridium acetobutylicum]
MTVLITGASTGIGYEITRIFARNGYDVVITARDEKRLMELAENINTKVTVIKKDLSKPDSANELFNEIKENNIEVDILVNNAGMGDTGFFHKSSVDKINEMLELNIKSLTILTRLVSAEMVKKRSGMILNVASTGSYMPGPFIAVYYATKAYVLSFTEAIGEELKKFNVKVSALCPGATVTEFSKRAGKLELKGAMSAKSVAEIAYKEFMNGKKVIIPGGFNKIGILFSKIFPRNMMGKIIGKSQRKLHEEFMIKNNISGKE